MGVLGLWNVLESVGHPIKIEGLEGKILGVDANIWLYKFIRGFRDKDNATNIESHKLGLFNRISKLLYYRIRPVFVFDGPAPVLKRRTLERRQNLRNKHLSKVQDAAMKILASQLKTQYPDADIDHMKITMPNLVSNNLVAAEKLTDEDRDLFYLPETSELKNDDSESDESITLDNSFNDQQFMTTEVDIHSKDFEHLPAEMRYEILHDIKQSRRRIRNPENLPDDASSFSNFQLERLKARRKVQEKIEHCEKEICTNYTGELADGSSIQAFRVQSDSRATILYRNNTYDPKALDKVKQEEEAKAEEVKIEEFKIEERDQKTTETSGTQGSSSQTRSMTENRSSFSAEARLVDSPKTIKVLANRLKSYKPANGAEQTRITSPDLSSPDLSSPDPSSPDNNSPEQSPAHQSSHDLSSTQILSQEPQSPKPDSPRADWTEPESPTIEYSSKTGSPQPCSSKQSVSEPSTSQLHVQDEIESDDEVTELFPPPTTNVKDSATDAHHDSDISIIYDNNNRTITIDSDGDMTNRTEFIGDSSDSEDEQPTDGPVADEKLFDQDVARASKTDEPKKADSDSEESDGTDILEPEQQSAKQVDVVKEDVVDRAEKTKKNVPVERTNVEKSSQSSQFRPPTPTRTNKVTNKVVEDAKELLRLFGIPYIDAAGEAEAQCAKLEELKLTEGTITDDSDIWLFGSQNVYRYFFSDDKYVMQYKMTDIEFHVRMTRENLVCFAMLVGSDYTDGIMNVGPVTALEVLSEFPGEGMEPLTQFRDWHHEAIKDLKAAKKDVKRRKLLKYRLPDEFPSRTVYDGYLRPVADTSAEKFTWGTPELDELREYARRNFGWDPKKVDDKLVPVMKRLNEKKVQKTIDTFFFKTQANRNPEMFRSKRVNQALNKIAKRAALDEKVSVPEVLNLSEDED